ncbi:MAG: putative tricarboxylic transport rane protein [Fusobacteriaceae bacterium]|jgi:putative tricarboxylic transport membrane protein|nr:hypothetical protein [Fusobacteriales bacterium]MDN5303597.1 putative tricarboxylic transport rane protein [Fusobacteriaceae bacterium]
MKKINIAIGIIFIIFSSFIYMKANTFKQTLIVDIGLGADFFPKLISIIIILISILLIYLSIKNKELSNNVSSVFNSDMKNSIIGMFLLIIYGISLNIIGYLISTIIFCYIFLHIFKVKNILLKITISLIFSLIIYFIFNRVFLITLPVGILI